MRKNKWSGHQLELRANSKLGVIRVATLLDLNVSSVAAYRQCRPGGPWQRLLPGVLLLHNGPPTSDQLVTAALMRCGQDAMITGLEACRRYGLNDVPHSQDVHVLVPHRQRVQSSEYMVVERTHRLPPAVLVGGFPLAPSARAVLDACRRTHDVDAVTNLLVSAVQRGLCSPAQLSDELESGSPRGTAIPRRVLADLELVRSVAEKDALELTRRIGLTTEHWNRTLLGPDGSVIGRPDAWFGDVGLVWEIDSKRFHYDPKSYARTLERNARYAAHGILVLQTLPSRLRTDPDGVAKELLSAHKAAAGLPPPRVRVV